MRTFSMLALTLGSAIIIGTSCNNSGGGRSTPLDSTNDLGTAPVQYQGGTPDVTVDSTMQSAPYEKRDRQDNSNARSMQEAQGNQPGQPAQSNTTDPKTTSGSERK